jgi:hypothetical protein
VNRSGADAKRFSRFEDSRPGRQPLTDALDNFGAYRATPEPLTRAQAAREVSINAASATTRLSILNLILRGSGSGKLLTKDQGGSIDLENRKGR